LWASRRPLVAAMVTPKEEEAKSQVIHERVAVTHGGKKREEGHAMLTHGTVIRQLWL